MDGQEGALGREFVRASRQQLAAAAELIRHGVGQLDDTQVWWRPRDNMNSIANLLLHLAGNLRQRFPSVIGGAPDDRDRTAEFAERGAIPKAELLRRFDEAVGQADAVLAGLSPDELIATRRYPMLSGPVEEPIAAILLQTLTHLVGHAQEIIHLTRQQLGDGYAFRSPAGVPPSMRPKTS